MKKSMIAALALMSSLSAVAHAECTKANDVAVDYALAYLSIMEQGGMGYTDPVETQMGRSAEQLCAKLSSSKVASASTPGFINVELNLDDESCTVTMKLTRADQIEKISLVSCKKK